MAEMMVFDESIRANGKTQQPQQQQQPAIRII